MKYLSIKNWKEYQSYKDRKPLWIKVYHEILDKYKEDGTPGMWRSLPTEERLMLVCLWLLAARHDNQIPYDDAWLEAQTGCNPACVTRLLQDGCVFCDDIGAPLVQACNKPVTESVQKRNRTVPSENRDQRTEIRDQIKKQHKNVAEEPLATTETLPGCEDTAILDVVREWNAVANANGLGVKRFNLSADTKRHIHARLSEDGWLEDFRAVLERIPKDDWLLGKVPPGPGYDKPYKLTFKKLIMSPESVADILERPMAGDAEPESTFDCMAVADAQERGWAEQARIAAEIKIMRERAEAKEAAARA